MLQSLGNDEVTIRLKWGGTQYTGRLVSVDSYMNVQLSGAEEWIEGKSQGTLGQVLIRYVSCHLRRLSEENGTSIARNAAEQYRGYDVLTGAVQV